MSHPGRPIPVEHHAVFWEEDESFLQSPYNPPLGSVYAVRVVDQRTLAQADRVPVNRPPDTFVNLMRHGWRSDADLLVALQEFAKIEGEVWAVTLRDALALQLQAEAKGRDGA